MDGAVITVGNGSNCVTTTRSFTISFAVADVVLSSFFLFLFYIDCKYESILYRNWL